MQPQVRLGAQIYYVPKFDAALARYVPVTRLHFSLNPPLVTLGHHLVIEARPSLDGTLGRDRVGTYWISKEAYEAHQARKAQSIWRWLELAFRFEVKKLWRSASKAAVPVTDRLHWQY